MTARVAAIEEHFWLPELRDLWTGFDVVKLPRLTERLIDFGALRLGEMDEAGIDIQVLSHVGPGTAKLDGESAIRLARAANDMAQEVIRAHPGRFAAFAELPTPDPQAAADELERCVAKLGFKGAMINGLTHDRFIDEADFHPILARAQELDVPVYIHPSTPHPAVIEAYYRDHPSINRAAWGFGMEAGTQALRLITGGVFDKFPRLKIILGHLGEALPFWLWRCDIVLNRMGHLKRPVRDYVNDHFHITTSGHFSQPALQCCLAELGAERILFAVDWPWQSNVDARRFIAEAALSEDQRDMILRRNAARLLGL